MRYNEAVNIIAKVKSTSRKSVVDLISSRNPFGLATNVRGISKYKADTLTLYSSNGVSYLESSNVEQGREFIKQYKIMISRVTSEHAGEPDKDGKYKVIAKIRLLKPNEICTDSYVIACPSEKREVTENFYSYLCTKFTRFLILQTLSSINLSRDRYEFVPMQDFSRPWTDEELYAKYGLTKDEIDFIESMIKPMEAGGDDDGS